MRRLSGYARVVLVLLFAAYSGLGQPSNTKGYGSAPTVVPDARDSELVQAENTLTASGLATDGESLLEFFRQRSRLDGDWEKLAELTRQLGASSIEVRGRTAVALVSRGPVAIPLLRQAVNDLDDPDVADRARRCLKLIEGPDGALLPMYAARLLAERKPAGAAKVLLAYLPFSDNAVVAEQVGKALAAVAFPGGKADPALIQALEDALPLRRAFAGEALCSKQHPEQYPVVRKLLSDPKPAVRLKAAMSLAKEHDAEAIPVLIDLLADMAPPQRKPIEELLQELAGEWTPNLNLPGDDDISRRIRRDAWAGWWKQTDGPVLLAEFRKRTMTPAEIQKVENLIKKLGDDSYQVREQAVADLVAYGQMAVPLLKEAVKQGELERKIRAEHCLRAIAKAESRSLPPAAARLLAIRKPEGSVDTLLAFLPWAQEEALSFEVQNALALLAVKEGKVDPAIVKAVDDNLSIRRTAAGIALARAGLAEHRAAVRKLMKDADPSVRVKVALASATAKDKEAVPVLIDILGEFPREHTEQVHEALFMLAGDKAPDVSLGDDAASRKKCRDAWADWWKDNADKVDLAKLTTVEGFLGYTLLAQISLNQSIGRVVELGRDGKPRWQIENLNYPVDARMLGPNRVLIVEYNGNRVTERDLKGTIIWQAPPIPGNPVCGIRLRNGNTFIATQNEMMEVDRAGKEVFRKNISQLGYNMYACAKIPNGEIVFFTSNGMIVRLDAKGNQIKTFNTGRGGTAIGAMDVLPNGRVLIADTNQNIVTAYDPDGKTLFTINVQGPTTASWLPNGNVLCSCYNLNRVVEVDRQGRVVWERRENFHHFRARRR